MAFSISKLLGKKTNTVTSNDTVAAIIKDVENKPYGVSNKDVLFAGLNELGGYYIFQTVIVGQLSVKSKNGANLLFVGKNFKLQLNADMLEFESESSSIKGRNITKIDFQIDEDDIKKLEKVTLYTIQLNVKKHVIVFSKHIGSSDEEE